ncbi:MAG: cytochrome c oxidase assembly protein [Vicinamibacterales bacterium]
MPILALLHPVTSIGWTQWTINWSTVVGIGALAALYVWRASVERGASSVERTARSNSISMLHAPRSTLAHQRLAFASGLIIMFVALNGPLHDLSDEFLFSAHMVQHLLLTLVVPPLLIVGVPGWMLRPALRSPAVAAIARWITRPAICFTLFNVVVAVWHLPPAYNLAMANHPVHIVEHLMFMTSAVIMWWPFLSPLPELPRLAYPGQMLYCFLMSIPMSVVAVSITMADHILYPAYAAAPRVWNLTPMDDQQTGGLIMWIPGGMFFYLVMSVVFFKWAQKQDDSTAGAQVA